MPIPFGRKFASDNCYLQLDNQLTVTLIQLYNLYKAHVVGIQFCLYGSAHVLPRFAPRKNLDQCALSTDLGAVALGSFFNFYCSDSLRK